MGITAAVGVREQVEVLFEDARTRCGIPERVARQAADATLRWLQGVAPPVGAAGCKRVSAYYWAVVRRRALAGAPGLAAYRSRCIAATLAADMISAGHAREHVLAELTRLVGAQRAMESMSAEAA